MIKVLMDYKWKWATVWGSCGGKRRFISRLLQHKLTVKLKTSHCSSLFCVGQTTPLGTYTQTYTYPSSRICTRLMIEGVRSMWMWQKICLSFPWHEIPNFTMRRKSYIWKGWTVDSSCECVDWVVLKVHLARFAGRKLLWHCSFILEWLIHF